MSSSIGRYVRRHHVGLIAVFLALGGGVAVAATQPGADGDIDACFKKKSGQLFVQKKAKCKKGTKAISWSQIGPQGDPGPRGLTGAAGSARAYGRVASDGTLTRASANVSISHPAAGVYCISVTGISSASASVVAGLDYNDAGIQFGTTQFRQTNDVDPDPVGPNGSSVPFVAWDSIPNVCAAGQFEVRTFEQKIDTSLNQIKTQADNKAFAFLVP